MRLLLSGGGTAGHVYPALAVVEELQEEARGSKGLRELEVLYVGSAEGLEAKIVPAQGLAFRTVRTAAVRGVSGSEALANAIKVLAGSLEAWRILRMFSPDVAMATGGYVSVPAVIAARLQACPVLVYLPDIQPGLAVRFLSRLAQRVAVSFDASLMHFAPDKATATGYPVRSALYSVAKETARQHLDLLPEWKTVLVVGGSRGSHSINLAISQALDELLQLAQVIHISGDKDLPWLRGRRAELPIGSRERYHVCAFMHQEMIDAIVAADLAVARAGAATMGEFAAVGLPSILVPYPYSGRHQEANADFMVNRGAALQVGDAELAEGALWRALERLLADEDALGSMSQKARELARPDAARAIANQLALLSGGARWVLD